MGQYDDIQTALTAARDTLKTLNEKIGRESRDTRKRTHWDRDSNNGHHKGFEEADKRSGGHRAGGGGGGVAGPGGKRSRNNVFSRLEPRNHGGGRGGEPVRETAAFPQKPRLHSRVTKELPRREDIVAAQSDEQSRARNRRMFNSLLGTLNKFNQDESRLRKHVEKKAIIEKKVEEQELRERETIKMERHNLFVDRKKKLMEVRLLEIKMNRMQDLALWEENHQRSRDYIRTKTSPQVYFRPKVLDDTTQKLLQESQQLYDDELAKKREEFEKGMLEVERRLQKELEKALEEKPVKDLIVVKEERDAHEMEGDHRVSFGRRRGDSPSEGEEDMEDGQELDQERPRLVSQVVKSQVDVSVKNHKADKPDRRHVLQSAINKNMIISVVNTTYEGGGADL